MLSELITFDRCTFEENAGPCIKQDSDVTCSTNIKGCKFNKNKGGSGCCIYGISSQFSTHPYITVEDNIFSENTASMYGGERGVVCADTLAIHFVGVNQFINNEATSADEEGNSLKQSKGGLLFLSQEEPAE